MRNRIVQLIAAALAAFAVAAIGLAVLADSDSGSDSGSDAGSDAGSAAQSDLVIGIDGHDAGWPQDEVEQRADLGAAVTRHEWDLDNPPSSEEEQVLAAATEIDTRIHALLGENDIGDPDDYRMWVLAFVRRWGPGGSFWLEHPELDESRHAIRTIELGNEPYLGDMSADEYADAVRPTLEGLAELRRPVDVILPAPLYGGDTDWIETLYEEIPRLNTLFEGFALHPYWYGHHPAEPGPEGPMARIGLLRTVMDQHGAGSKPIYITEYGESTASCDSDCVDEPTQAQHLEAMVDAVVSRQEWKVAMLVIYQLKDHGTDSGDREEQFGLLREDGTPKPSYSIAREAMADHGE